MNQKINTIIESKKGRRVIQLFGYSSNGVPGLEILGLGAKGKIIKEKLIFVSRQFGLKFKAKRFVICIDEDPSLIQGADWQGIEVPVGLLFWTIAGHLPLNNLEKCFACGRIELNGTIEEGFIGEEELKTIQEYISIQDEKSLFFIGRKPLQFCPNIKYIPITPLLGDLKQATFR
jgi:hypothetical protein